MAFHSLSLRFLAAMMHGPAAGLNEIRLERFRHRLRRLRAAGLQAGRPMFHHWSTFIDEEYCHLISIGSYCGLSSEVKIFAHDPTPQSHLGAVRVGRVLIHDGCHLGVRTIVMPGVEIGPRTIVAARSVVTSDLPSDSFCAGNPARPYATLEQYLDGHRKKLADATLFPSDESRVGFSPQRRAEVMAAVSRGDTYIVSRAEYEERKR